MTKVQSLKNQQSVRDRLITPEPVDGHQQKMRTILEKMTAQQYKIFKVISDFF